MAQEGAGHCFYQCGLPPWPKDYLAVDVPLSARACLTLGLSEDVDGQVTSSGGFWFPRHVALLMAGSWPSGLCKSLISDSLSCLACKSRTLLWVAGHCCCLLETFWARLTAITSRSWGTGRDLVQAAHDQLAVEFGRHAFRLRGAEAVTSGVLGLELRDGWAQAQVSKVILLREALNRLSARHEPLATRGRKSWGTSWRPRCWAAEQRNERATSLPKSWSTPAPSSGIW